MAPASRAPPSARCCPPSRPSAGAAGQTGLSPSNRAVSRHQRTQEAVQYDQPWARARPWLCPARSATIRVASGFVVALPVRRAVASGIRHDHDRPLTNWIRNMNPACRGVLQQRSTYLDARSGPRNPVQASGAMGRVSVLAVPQQAPALVPDDACWRPAAGRRLKRDCPASQSSWPDHRANFPGVLSMICQQASPRSISVNRQNSLIPCMFSSGSPNPKMTVLRPRRRSISPKSGIDPPE